MELKEKGCVYFFRHIGLTPIKIGYSTNDNPTDRFNQFKTYAPYGSEIIGFIMTDSPKELETKLHMKYISKRLFGEWFEITEQEANNEIDFHSKIEDIKDRNEFQQAWAKELELRKTFGKNIIEESNNLLNQLSAKEKFLKMYAINPKLNRSITAQALGVSRRAVYHWINTQEISNNPTSIQITL